MSTKVDKPYSDIDKMLAEHDELYGDRNERLLTGRPPATAPAESVEERAARGEPDAVRRMEVSAELEAEYPYGPEPRKDWPLHYKLWTPELLAEREFWVRKFVEEEGLNFVETGLRLGLHETTIGKEARQLGLKRAQVKMREGNPRRQRRDARRAEAMRLSEAGLTVHEISDRLQSSPSTIQQDLREARGGDGKLQRRDARREEVRRLFEQNLGVPEICEQLNAAETTIRQDLRAMGLRKTQPADRVTNKQAVAMVTKALGTMEDMANLLLNLPELEILQVEEEQAEAWLQQLRRLSRAGSRVRKAATKGTQT